MVVSVAFIIIHRQTCKSETVLRQTKAISGLPTFAPKSFETLYIRVMRNNSWALTEKSSFECNANITSSISGGL